MYSSWSGGQTAAAAEGLVGFLNDPAKTPYLQSVPEPYPNDPAIPANVREWSTVVAKWELRNIAGGGAGTAGTVTIPEKGPSGRAMKVRLGSKDIPGPQLRSWLGTSNLRSTLITGISSEGNNVRFTGRGWGHGVGMSQWGAFSQANAGQNHEAIIRHYFTGIDIHTLWP